MTFNAYAVIQAESYTSMFGVTVAATLDTGGGNQVAFIDEGDWLGYTAVDFGPGQATQISFRYATPYPGGIIDVRLDDRTTGPIVGRFVCDDTGDWAVYTTGTLNLNGSVTGVHDLYLVFHNSTSVCDFNWFQFSRSTQITPKTWADGEQPTYDVLDDEIFSRLRFLFTKPILKVSLSTSQPMTTGNWYWVGWDFVETDNYGFFDTSTPTIIKPTVPGWYRGWLGGAWKLAGSTADATGSRIVGLQRNGYQLVRRHDLLPDTRSGVECSYKGVPFEIDCNGTTDYLEMGLWQNSGSTMYTPDQALWAEHIAEFYIRWHARL